MLINSCIIYMREITSKNINTRNCIGFHVFQWMDIRNFIQNNIKKLLILFKEKKSFFRSHVFKRSSSLSEAK